MQYKVPSLFLPNLDFFSQLVNVEKVVIDLDAKYTKQSFANRCYIKGPHKIEQLVVPISKPAKYTTIKEVKIAYAEDWKTRNWRTICNCYRKSPYFEFYEPYLKQILLEKTFERLIELNTELLTLCLKLTQLNTPVCQGDLNITKQISIDYKKTGQYSSNFRPFYYLQNFGSDFVPNLSVIDLICCKGPESLDILNKSNPNEQL